MDYCTFRFQVEFNIRIDEFNIKILKVKVAVGFQRNKFSVKMKQSVIFYLFIFQTPKKLNIASFSEAPC